MSKALPDGNDLVGYEACGTLDCLVDSQGKIPGNLLKWRVRVEDVILYVVFTTNLEKTVVHRLKGTACHVDDGGTLVVPAQELSGFL